MLIRIVRMTFHEDEVDNFLAVFNKSKSRIRNFEGCRHLELHKDYNKDNVYITYSHWDSEDALNKYRHSELFAGVWADTKALFADKPVAYSHRKVMAVG